ncbi:LANO_0H05974g1_1 [Lachancea nothofagi CBS 11611]|uniref:LANO_0H05974g1_1 n=1 Tax=Lachancea nothofagi CBS 11611 TaxID=1266666 RepID=A0A1G4KLL6_9SACH|nr:LANO_0H05974g1_1 [Lachancea nothofagi CBS 11611]
MLNEQRFASRVVPLFSGSNKRLQSERVVNGQANNSVDSSNTDGAENVTEDLTEGLTESDNATNISPLQGYLIVLSGFIANFIIFGIAFTFGVFQDYYLSPSGPLYGKPVSAVTAIGSLATGTTYLFTIANRLITRYMSIKNSMILGSFVMSLGLICASFAQQTWQFLLSQGVMFGVGGSMIYLSPVTHAPPYFSAHRGIAMGLLFSGTGFGGLALAPLTRYLISKVGWQWALRIFGFVSLICITPTSFLVRPHPTSLASQLSRLPKEGNVSLKFATSKIFILHMFGAGLQSGGYLIPGFFMSTYSKSLGFTTSQGTMFIGVNNAVNACSKVAVGYFADKVGRLNMLVVCSFFSTVTVLALWLVPTRGTFISFVILYGVASGPMISLIPTCMVELFGVQNYQASSGFLYFSRGVGTFLGSPIAGTLIKGNPNSCGSYRNAICYNGIMFFADFICLTYIRLLEASKHKWKLKQ